MSKEEKNNNVSEPYANYQQPLNFEKVWLMFQETDKKFQETDKMFQDTDKKIKKLSELIGNYGNNHSDVAETFFYNGLAHSLSLGKHSFSHIDRNVTRRKNRIESEYDIILYNSERIVVIEVKYKLHPQDITRFLDKKLSRFRFLYPEYNQFKLLAGVAAFDIPVDCIEIAREKGLFILTPDGKNIQLLNDDEFIPTAF